jgi:hypothetical protein
VPLDRQAAAFLAGVCAGRAGGETMLLRDDGRPWGSSHQQRPLAAACAAARLEPPVTFHGLRHTWASQRIMRGLPVMVAAQVLGHADTRMVERHYGHLARGYVQQAIERTGMALGDEPAAALPSGPGYEGTARLPGHAAGTSASPAVEHLAHAVPAVFLRGLSRATIRTTLPGDPRKGTRDPELSCLSPNQLAEPERRLVHADAQ